MCSVTAACRQHVNEYSLSVHTNCKVLQIKYGGLKKNNCLSLLEKNRLTY